MTERLQDPERRRPWKEGSEAVRSGWLALSDDDLLYRIECLGPDHDEDDTLLEIIDSSRHFFVRQEAAKKIREVHRLKEHSEDRHIGQILVRGMTRQEDVDYLRKLLAESRHLEVRKAAEAQLRALTRGKK